MLGTNGAGKTTMIEVLEGLQHPRGGRVRVLGMDPIRNRKPIRRRTGVMLQDGGVSGQLAVRETVDVWRGLTARPRESAEVVGSLPGIAVMVAWFVVTVLMVQRWFRWEPRTQRA